MNTFFRHLLDRIRSSFWVIPASLLALAIALAIILVQTDHDRSAWLMNWAPWLKDVSPEGTETLLGTVATSVLTLAGVTFSVTIVALTLASSQFGPRLLRNFIRSRANQSTLGILLATHAYCLVVLRSVRVGDYSFVPHLATFGAFLLTLVSLGFFIYFIHHVVTSIQAEQVVAQVYRELCSSIERNFPAQETLTLGERLDGEGYQGGRSEEEVRIDEGVGWQFPQGTRLSSRRSGYLQAVEIEALVASCRRRGIRCRLLVKPGEFLVRGKEIMVLNESGPLGDEDDKEMVDHFLVGPQATAEQDFEYCIRQLVEVALRALSPGVNDPFTAINCIDYLGAGLVEVVRRRRPPTIHEDEDGVPRVRTVAESFAGFLGAACNQIRQAAVDKPAVSVRLLEMLAEVGCQCRRPEQLQAVKEQADLVAPPAERSACTEFDASIIEERYRRVKKLEMPV